MKRFIAYSILVLIFAFPLMAFTPSVQIIVPGRESKSRAPNIPPTDVKLTVMPLDSPQMSKPFFVTILVQDVEGHNLNDRNVQFYLDGQYMGQAKSSFGIASLKVTKGFAAGQHKLLGLMLGDRDYSTATVNSVIDISQSIVQVQTVPPLPGVVFKFSGKNYTTSADGIVKIPVDHAGNYRLEFVPNTSPDPNVRFQFSRWLDEVYTTYHDVSVPLDNKTLQLGLDVYYRVGQTFVDLDGKPVDLSRIASVTIKNQQGDSLTFPADGQMRWLYASGVARRSSGLESVPIQYSTMNVTVDGSNVVNEYQQRFYGHPGEVWKITLLLYGVHVSAHDAIFRFPVGNGILLQYPDGRVLHFPFNQNGDVSIPSLARGSYRVQVSGVSGLSSITPIALSQDQDVSLMIPTALDIALALGVGLLFALALLIIGRPWLLLGRRAKPANIVNHQMRPGRYVS
jgi:hypothetical protein